MSQTGLDSGTCTSASPCATVSYALTKAASGATIEVSGTINDHPVISSPVTITTWPGGPAVSPAVLDGTTTGYVVTVNSGVTHVTLHDLTIENGGTDGGVLNQGTLTLTDSAVSGNAGNGITNDGTMPVIDSTVTKNALGIGNYEGAPTMTVMASTITGNTSGGVYGGDCTLTLGATFVAGNTGFNCEAYDAGSLYSTGYNLTNDKTGMACDFTAATDLVNKNPLHHRCGRGGFQAGHHHVGDR